MKSFITKTLITGVFLVVPVGVLGYTLAKTLGKLRKLAEPFAAKLNIDSPAGFLTLDALIVLAVVSAIFMVGLFARLTVVAARVQRIDQRLEGYVPGYAVLKGIIGGALGQETSMTGFKTVLARYNGTAQIGFEVDRSDTGGVVVFLPNTPSPRTGVTVIFDPADIEPMAIPPHKAMEMLTFFGKGAADVLSTGLQQRGLVLAHPAKAA